MLLHGPAGPRAALAQPVSRSARCHRRRADAALHGRAAWASQRRRSRGQAVIGGHGVAPRQRARGERAGCASCRLRRQAGKGSGKPAQGRG